MTGLQGMPRVTRGHQLPEEGREQILLQSFQKDLTMATPSFLTSDLQTCEIADFCCLKPPSLWSFIAAALRNKYHLYFFQLEKNTVDLYMIQRWGIQGRNYSEPYFMDKETETQHLSKRSSQCSGAVEI